MGCWSWPRLIHRHEHTCSNSHISNHLLFYQGARRIVSEWPDLDSEARQFTAKILGEEVVTLETPAPVGPMQTSGSDASSKGDLESKAELWYWDTGNSTLVYFTSFGGDFWYLMCFPFIQHSSSWSPWASMQCRRFLTRHF